MRQMQKNAGSGAMGFGKSRARMLTEKQGRVTFADVAGIDEAREELQEIVEFLKDPGNASPASAARSPRARCWSARPAPARRCSPAPSRVRRACPSSPSPARTSSRCSSASAPAASATCSTRPRRSAPCIVFIDEIDAVGRHRGAGLGNGNDEREQTLNQLLVEMDGFEANEGIIIIAATNRPDVLDPALLRPGRFDRQVVVPRPDIDGREQILAVHMKKVPLAPDVDPRVIARGTPGFSGADLANLVNEAALLAARKGKRLVAMQEFEEAKDKVMMGTERKSMVMTEDEKSMTAYHEAGHAIVALHEPASDPIHKATIIPRGRALGMVMRLPERDNYSYHRDKMYANLAVVDGRPRRRGTDLRLRQGQLGRLVRHQLRDRPRPRHGHPLGHVRRARPAAICRGRRGGVPRLFGQPPEEHVERDRAGDRQGNPPHRRAGLRPRQASCSTEHREQLETLAKALLEYETLSRRRDQDGARRRARSTAAAPRARRSRPRARRSRRRGASRRAIGGPAPAGA